MVKTSVVAGSPKALPAPDPETSGCWATGREAGQVCMVRPARRVMSAAALLMSSTIFQAR